MNRSHDPARLDAQLRQLHATALTSLPPQTLARLRQARHAAAPTRSRRGYWLLATACSGLLVIGIGLQLHPSQSVSSGTAPTSPVASTSATTETDDLLAQNPDLYVWLGSDTALAME
ncbi:hypothetical protein LN565_00215 [Xanthomonas euvesicatoria pv. euvesicatoria]|uniref:Uncharacterized protein n=4 Tax=Xanthomonas euvesicatoria TaxID=456327 RepID=A0A6B3KMD2_XANEU|nr:hypothetical protein [Xanthomonas euvesicatoria]MBV6785595.1 hypothetical protein [Xanthomonas campestris pv. uppalii]MBV6793037.1 hypothetical protein [Xanthomonas campestris pv. daturae]AOY68552.1 hypothetical protein BHE83_19715 [Xanthomonas euvesicatoria pv. vesicatoria str. 85-10]APO91664.1 hypothetical protein BJD11_18000 [Xanthomonas euvesicatoria]KHL54891.1 membrane protein [Xanthomonas euvesicatoria]